MQKNCKECNECAAHPVCNVPYDTIECRQAHALLKRTVACHSCGKPTSYHLPYSIWEQLCEECVNLLQEDKD